MTDKTAVRYPFDDALPAPGEAMASRPGVWWIRMPLPFALDHINLWLLEDGDGWTVVDTGLRRGGHLGRCGSGSSPAPWRAAREAHRRDPLPPRPRRQRRLARRRAPARPSG